MTSPFTPSPTDGAIEILRVIFGPVMDSVLTGNTVTAATVTTNMLGAAFGYFNSGILFFGSLILMFVTVFGISNSANDGVALGKKWSTFYTPIRSLVAAGSLIPMASGYAGIQLGLLLIVTYSIGFASNMWKTVVEQNVGGNIVEESLRSVTESPSFNEMVLSALKMQVCAQGVNDAMHQVMPNSDLRLSLTTIDRAPTMLIGGSKIMGRELYFSNPTWPAGRSICGELVISNIDISVNRSNSFSSDSVVNSLRASITTIRNQFAEKFAEPNGEVAKMAAKIVEATRATDGQPLDPADFAASIHQMQANMIAEIKTKVGATVREQNADIVEKYTAKGWIYAGSLWREMASIKDAVRSASLVQTVTFTAGTESLNGVLTGDMLSAAEPVLTRYMTVASKLSSKTSGIPNRITPTSPVLPQIKTNFSASDFTSGSTDAISTIKSFFSKPGVMIVNGVVSFLSDDKQDPILKLKDLGDYLAGFAELLLYGKGSIIALLQGFLDGVKTASAGTPLAGLIAGPIAAVIAGLQRFLVEMSVFINHALFFLLYAGYFLGIWIPMVPFYVFAMGVIGWLIFVIEMLAAGVLWMAAHTTPAKEDSFIGSQTQGYLLVLSGFFRPALMVLGLVASNALMGPVISYINQGFMLAFQSIQADSTTGLMSVAGFISVYVLIIGSVVMLIFSLPQSLPDRILKWIGAGIGDLGEQGGGQKIDQSASTQSRRGAMGLQMLEASKVKTASEETSKKEADATKATAATAQQGRDAHQERQTAAMERAFGVEGQGGSSTVANNSAGESKGSKGDTTQL